MKPIILTVVSVMIMLTVGCMPDYNPSSYIEKYRIVGVEVDPPAVEFNPEYQGQVTLRLVDAWPMPADDGQVDPTIDNIEWSVCLMSAGASANYACTMEEIPLTDVSDDGRTARFDGALIAFGLEMIGENFDAMIEGLRQVVEFTDDCNKAVITDYDDCMTTGDETTCNGPAFEGFKACVYENGLKPVFQIRIDVTDMLLDDADEPVLDVQGRPIMRERTLQAYKTASFGHWTEENPANRNPEFSLRVGSEWSDILDITNPDNLIVTTLGDRKQPDIQACPGETLAFVATVPPGSIDQIPVGDGTQEDEFWQMSWYTNNGRFKKLRTGSATWDESEPDLTNLLTFDEDDEIETTTVTVVMRDEQLGLNHLRFTIHPQPGDRCRRLVAGKATQGGAK